MYFNPDPSGADLGWGSLHGLRAWRLKGKIPVIWNPDMMLLMDMPLYHALENSSEN